MNEALNRLLLLELFLTKLKPESYLKYEKALEEFYKQVVFYMYEMDFKPSDINELYRMMKEEVKPIYQSLYEDSLADAEKIALLESAMIGSIYGLETKTEAIKYAININKNSLIHGYRLGDSFKANEAELVRKFGAVIADGLKNGKHSRTIKRELKHAKDKTLTHIRQTTIRSVIGLARQQAQEATYRQVEKVIDGYYEFVATLDNRTCIAKGQKVKLSNGTLKNIEDVQEGDEVLTHKGNKAKVKASEKTGYKKVIRVTFSDGSVLVATPDHKVWDGRKWVRLDELKSIRL
jgi:hypothetical protein